MTLRIIGFAVLAVTITFCATTLPPAEPSATMMDQADRVILTIDEDPEIAYRNLSNHLLENGFIIQRSNIDALKLQTGFKEYGATVYGILGGYSMRINASVKDSTITLSGVLNTGTEVENNGGETSPVKSGWNEVVKLAKDFPSKKISYSRS